MSAVLLDTHIFLWGHADRSRLSAGTRDMLDDPEVKTLLSVASCWEIGIKHSAGKLALPEEPATYLPHRLDMSSTSVVPIELPHALRAASLPAHHRDPFDRLIVAQAQLLRLPVITVDPAIKRYDVEIIDG